MLRAYVPFQVELGTDMYLTLGKWYYPTFQQGEFIGPYDSYDAAIVAARDGWISNDCKNGSCES